MLEPCSKAPRTVRRASQHLALAASWLTLALTSAVAHAQTVTIDNMYVTPRTLAVPPVDSAALAKHGTSAAACPTSTADGFKDYSVYTPSLSTSVFDSVNVRIWTPSGAKPAAGWPVLYLLTGQGASYSAWSCMTFLKQYLSGVRAMVVMPDGSRAESSRWFDMRTAKPHAIDDGKLPGQLSIPGLYSNWAAPSTDGSPERWETFIMVDLPKIVRAYGGDTSKQTIAGLSMGGFGSVYLALQYPGAFKAVGSFSGPINPSAPEGKALVTATLANAGQDTKAPFGDAVLDAQYLWRFHDPAYLVAPVNGGLWPQAQTLYTALGNGSKTLFLAADYGLSVELGAESQAKNFLANLLSGYNTFRKLANPSAPTVTAVPNVSFPRNTGGDHRFGYPGDHNWQNWDGKLCQALPLLVAPLGTGTSYAAASCSIVDN
jgi:S-formylglutathione hydrolase FrmB